MEEQRALRLMGRILTLSRLRVQSADTQAIIEDLTQLTVENPNLKQGLPVIIESQIDLDLSWLVKILRKTGLQVLGVSDGILTAQASALELPILPPDHTQPRNVKPATPAAKPNTPAPVSLPARIITDPVRSGQQIYAERSDLIVMAPVSPGAELIADGCIHVYNTLRGRAIAGAAGNPGARIFCKKMEAELLAIAGVYMVSEQIPTQLHGKGVQCWLSEDSHLEIESLDY
ncbi:septum site-determining protein MinC [Fluviicoccus keumensis]|uniref:Probable septum site-determining protein MinC n=1 Tax=Fluviicoccus keumensis TaxID=1435465 RepID=A0A4V2G5L0_9GAMM|nr:septum site-determining protein MinC [Fluviicoccus keumensis]RZU45296.1 septum site-determining protein MinC [Fluviicoccus keumensis]